MAKLGVNIDHVATLRQVRGNVKYPDPISAALIAVRSGADQVTVHLREDRRHIQDSDLFALRSVIKSDLNLELAAVDEIVGIACKARPDVCTFVPERRQELTTEGGLEVIKNFDILSGYIRKLKDKSIIVSMFIDADILQVEASKEAGADAIELHTGRYCESRSEEELIRLKDAAKRAKDIGLHVAAGHGLNYDNVALVVASIPEIVEYNIGHSIIARAVFVGLETAVKEMKALIGGG